MVTSEKCSPALHTECILGLANAQRQGFYEFTTSVVGETPQNSPQANEEKQAERATTDAINNSKAS